MNYRILLFMVTGALCGAVIHLTYADGCYPDEFPYSSRKIDAHTIEVMCVKVANRERLQAIDAELPNLTSKIAHDRTAIEGWQNQLPDYLNSLEEWIALDEHAREETLDRATEAIVSLSLGFLRIRANQHIRFTEAQLNALYSDFASNSLNSIEFKELLEGEHLGAVIIKKWRTFDEYIEAMDRLNLAFQGLKESERKQYWHSFTRVLSLGLQDPKLTIMIAESDFAASALVGNLTARAARERIDQLLRLGDERLRAIHDLTQTYKAHVVRNNQLKAERNAILAHYN